jgi:hypothetical protein
LAVIGRIGECNDGGGTPSLGEDHSVEEGECQIGDGDFIVAQYRCLPGRSRFKASIEKSIAVSEL